MEDSIKLIYFNKEINLNPIKYTLKLSFFMREYKSDSKKI